MQRFQSLHPGRALPILITRLYNMNVDRVKAGRSAAVPEWRDGSPQRHSHRRRVRDARRSEVIGGVTVIRAANDVRMRLLKMAAHVMEANALTLPDIECAHTTTPSPLTEGGIKGCGEAAMLSVHCAFEGSVADALSKYGVLVPMSIPIGPQQVLDLIRTVDSRR